MIKQLKTIRNNFSKAAYSYDKNSDFHKEIALKLLESIKFSKPRIIGNILDIGTGPGWFTGRLSETFSNFDIFGIDSSISMINVAKKISDKVDFIVADAMGLPFKGASFDLVVSNLCFQWALDIKKVFNEINFALKPEGMFYATMFGFDTFSEVFESFKMSLDNEQFNITERRLFSMDEISRSLRKNSFRNINIYSEQFRIYFKDMIEILKWSKSIGANSLGKNRFIGKDLLSKTNKYYIDRFCDSNGVYSTFDIIWISAIK